MTDRDLLRECRLAHCGDTFPCDRCQRIDAALSEPQEQPNAAPQKRDVEHVGAAGPARIGVPAGAASIHSVSDGFGSTWACTLGLSKARCGLEVVRPGKVQCVKCDEEYAAPGAGVSEEQAKANIEWLEALARGADFDDDPQCAALAREAAAVIQALRAQGGVTVPREPVVWQCQRGIAIEYLYDAESARRAAHPTGYGKAWKVTPLFDEPNADQLRFALLLLYAETSEYIKLNNLGDVHHSKSMQIARDMLLAAAGGKE